MLNALFADVSDNAESFLVYGSLTREAQIDELRGSLSAINDSWLTPLPVVTAISHLPLPPSTAGQSTERADFTVLLVHVCILTPIARIHDAVVVVFNISS